MSVTLRDQPYAMARKASVDRRMAQAAREPRHLAEYIAWFRREWEQECPPRLHQRGVEPESALGAPVLAGAFRAYLTGSPFQTDHSDTLDVDMRDAARIRPLHAALSVVEHRWPMSARAVFFLGFLGCEWQDITLSWGMLPETGHNFMEMALLRVWRTWARDRMGEHAYLVD